MQNIKLRSLILNLKSDAQKQMLELVLDVDFMTLTIL